MVPVSAESTAFSPRSSYTACVHEVVLGGIHDQAARQLAFVLLKVVFYLLAGWVLYRRRCFWKI